MRNCDYILVTINDYGFCLFKPYYKQDLEKWFIEAEVKKEECLFLEDFQEFNSEHVRNKKYIIIKGEIVLPKEEKIITKLSL